MSTIHIHNKIELPCTCVCVGRAVLNQCAITVTVTRTLGTIRWDCPSIGAYMIRFNVITPVTETQARYANMDIPKSDPPEGHVLVHTWKGDQVVVTTIEFYDPPAKNNT